jgi:hypothetical protein
MSAEDLMAALAAQLDEDETTAKAVVPHWPPPGLAVLDHPERSAFYPLTVSEAAHIARHDPARMLREISAKRAILTEHLPIESIYGLTCKRCASWQEGPWAEGGESSSEFGIAIPDPWPCLPVAAIAAARQDTLAQAVDVLSAGRALAEAEFLATLKSAGLLSGVIQPGSSPLTEEAITELRERWAQTRRGLPVLLTPLPRRTRLRLWYTRRIDSAACWLVDRRQFRAAIALWRVTGHWSGNPTI